MRSLPNAGPSSFGTRPVSSPGAQPTSVEVAGVVRTPLVSNDRADGIDASWTQCQNAAASMKSLPLVLSTMAAPLRRRNVQLLLVLLGVFVLLVAVYSTVFHVLMEREGYRRVGAPPSRCSVIPDRRGSGMRVRPRSTRP